jgi:superfamily I DNA/RNA helicase/RecB family exonuclease
MPNVFANSPSGSAEPPSRLRLVRVPVPPVEPPVLDAAQRAAVEHRGGPLLVLAGPGTGKTTTIVEAVVSRVERGEIAPEHALVLTFSRRAAGELRDRIAARLGRTIREPIARTFHSYAFGLLRAEAARRGEPAPRLLSGPEQDLVVRELLRGDVDAGAASWPAHLRPALLTRGFAQELRDLIQRAVERGVSSSELIAVGRRHRRDDWIAAGKFAKQYGQVSALREAASYDPAELIQAAVGLLRSESAALQAVRARHGFVVVDEYQDTDPAQEELLALVAGAGELLVVGDPDQSIYEFRGADADGIRRFPQAFRAPDGKPAKVLALQVCRRSGAELLAASRRVADRLGGPVAQRRLVAAEGLPPGRAEVRVLGSAGAEAAYVTNQLRQAHLVEGVPWSRMAVLVRGAAPLPALRRALQASGVPVAVRSDEQPLVDVPIVRAMLRIIEIATGRVDLAGVDGPTLAHELVTGPLGGADPLALRRLRQALRQIELAAGGVRASASLLAQAIADPGELAAIERRVAAPALRVANVLAAAREAVETASAEAVLWQIWQASGLARKWSAAALSDGSSAGGAGSLAGSGGSAGSGPASVTADRDLDAVVALFDAAARFADRLPKAGPSVFLDHLLGQQIPGDSLAPQAPDSDGVRVLTAHAAKGLEWDVVIVAGVQEGVWPDLRSRGSLLGAQQLVDVVRGQVEPGAGESSAAQAQALAARLAEERRLFYVAATRARRLLVVTAVRADDEQPSRFLDELVPVDSDERPLTRVPRGLDLASVVAQLRAVVVADPVDDAGRVRREAAAAQLARLANVGVRGADPRQWYGLAPITDDGPLAGADEPVRVSPSRVESFERCELRWLLEISGGTAADSAAQGIGTMIHAIAEQAAKENLDSDALRERFADAVTRVDVGVGWFAQRQRERAQTMLAKLIDWLRTGAGEFVAAEQNFEVTIGRAVLSGQVDRLELDDQGRLVVIDYKTGKSQPKKADVPMHPQLGAYQIAVTAGGFDDVAPGVRDSGGAALVQLGGKQQGFTTQRQEALPAGDDTWAHEMVRRAADGMAGSVFDATENDLCRVCPVRTSCPVQGEGRQVTA